MIPIISFNTKYRYYNKGEVEFGPEVSHDYSDSSVVKMDHVINK